MARYGIISFAVLLPSVTLGQNQFSASNKAFDSTNSMEQQNMEAMWQLLIFIKNEVSIFVHASNQFLLKCIFDLN